MINLNLKKILIQFFIIVIIFLIDRLSKIYILNITGEVDIYINSFLSFFLVWNTGIGFGLFSFEQNYFYNFITILIIIINLVILIMIIKSNDIKAYFLLFIAYCLLLLFNFFSNDSA